jgi:hypothetical protein
MKSISLGSILTREYEDEVDIRKQSRKNVFHPQGLAAD